MVQWDQRTSPQECVSNVGAARSKTSRAVETRNNGRLVSGLPAGPEPARQRSRALPDSKHFVVDWHYRTRRHAHGHLAIRAQLFLAKMDCRNQTRVPKVPISGRS